MGVDDVDEFKGLIQRNFFGLLDQLFWLITIGVSTRTASSPLPQNENTDDLGKEIWLAISLYSKLETRGSPSICIENWRHINCVLRQVLNGES